MTYDWESTFPLEIFEDSDAALEGSKFNVVGIAVENAETGEAALLKHPEVPSGGVLMADLWGDVYGDALRFYKDAVGSINGAVQ